MPNLIDKLINPCKCGSKPNFSLVNEVFYSQPTFKVMCLTCSCSSCTFNTHEEALRDWNRNHKSHKEIFIEAINVFGITSQINMSIEEAGELVTVLAKRNRTNNGSTIQDIIGEIVDMQIMLEQLKLIFNDGSGLFEKIINEKMVRLSKIIKLKR
jgi:hypothetical protein